MNQVEANSAAWDCMFSIVQWVRDHLKPKDVFFRSQLEEWALENGFVKKGES